MIDGTLGTTNTLLAILAVIAVLEGIALIVATVVVVFVCRHIRDLLGDLREQIPRLADRVDALTVQVTDVLADAREVVADVRDVSSRAAAGAERMQTAVAGATDVASLAVYSVFGRKAALATGIVRGVGLAYRILTRGSAGERSTSTGRRRSTTGEADDWASQGDAAGPVGPAPAAGTKTGRTGEVGHGA